MFSAWVVFSSLHVVVCLTRLLTLKKAQVRITLEGENIMEYNNQ